MYIFITSNRTKNWIRLGCFLTIFFFSACSLGGQNETDRIVLLLKEAQGMYGLQGCLSNGRIFFRASFRREDGIYQYMEPKRIELIKKFDYVGSVVCANDGVYFSARNDKMNLYRYDGASLQVVSESYNCSVVAKSQAGQYLCYRDEGFTGIYSIGHFDFSSKTYKSLFNSERFGLSEGTFFSSKGAVFGMFYDPGSETNYLKSIDIDGGLERSSLKLDCDLLSVISDSIGNLIYQCDSRIYVVNDRLEILNNEKGL